MTGGPSLRRAVAALVCVLAAAALWSAAAGTALGASSGAVRACIERNLVRYADPGNALDAQYADLEASCIAALDGDGTSAGFTPDPATGTTTDASGGAAPASGGGPPASGGGGTTPLEPATTSTGKTSATAPRRSGARPAPRSARQAPRESSKAIVLAAAANDGGAGAPMSDDLAGSPWFIGILVAAALIGGAALVIGARRRTR